MIVLTGGEQTEDRPMRAKHLPAAALLLIAAVLLSATVLPRPAGSVPFRPDVLQEIQSSGRLQSVVTGIREARDLGLDRPSGTARGWLPRPGDVRAIPDRNALVILVDFSDKVANPVTNPPSHYDAMLFSVAAYPTGSMRDWYLENSYGVFDVTGVVTVWLRMPQTYAYYVDNQAGFGTYPQNARKLAEDAVLAADPLVDFAQFDNDGPDGIPDSGDDDGFVDALFVVHAGLGREETGCDCDIHSHAWSMVNPVSVDGVTASSYSTEPENGKRGVFGHEFGHVLGLPDLYDTDYSSSGVGDWCMMSFGSWGGGGLTPVHFLSWCKARLGFLDPTVPLTNVAGALIPRIETSPTAFKLWTGGYPESESFWVENRQLTLSDVSLPGAGLVICHVDESVSGNEDESHPLVAIEQADGLDELAAGGASDNGDPWPGSTNHRSFDDASLPSTRDYAGNPTQVAVRNISNSAASMTADLTVESMPILRLSGHAIVEVGGNGDGDVDPGEQWQTQARIFNRGVAAASVTAILTTSDPDVSIQVGSSSFGTVPEETEIGGTPAFLQTLGAGETGDAVLLDVAINQGLGSTNHTPLIVGVNDALRFFEWTHERVTAGYGDQWHLSTQDNHTPGGSYSWKCGAAGAGSYENLLDAALYTRSLPLSSVTAFRFWHRIDAEEDVNQRAWDGGIVEASIDGGAWTQITPDGGYPYTVIPNPASPFAGGTPCFSGTAGWSQVRFDLSGLAGGNVQLRIRFGSDGYVAREGWYVDDVTIEGSFPSAVSDLDPAGRSLFLDPPRPNPAASAVAISFLQPTRGEASVTIVDPGGRRVMGWMIPAPQAPGGAHREVVWDGRRLDGSPAPSGVYFVRIDAAGVTQSRRFALIR
jgi:M6 family metalloprotease-like protein